MSGVQPFPTGAAVAAAPVLLGGHVERTHSGGHVAGGGDLASAAAGRGLWKEAVMDRQLRRKASLPRRRGPAPQARMLEPLEARMLFAGGPVVSIDAPNVAAGGGGGLGGVGSHAGPRGGGMSGVGPGAPPGTRPR